MRFGPIVQLGALGRIPLQRGAKASTARSRLRPASGTAHRQLVAEMSVTCGAHRPGRGSGASAGLEGGSPGRIRRPPAHQGSLQTRLRAGGQCGRTRLFRPRHSDSGS